jgi:hypothetical protein
MNLTLKVWRSTRYAGTLETYEARDVLEDMSFSKCSM